MSSRDSDALTPPSSRRGVVLVVDDDADMRQIIVRWLASASFRCLEARDGAEAVEMIEAHADDIEAVVLDVMMPGLDGFEVLQRVKSEPSTTLIPVLLLTAHATHETDVVRGMDGGAADYLCKPFSGPVLVAKLRSACQRRRSERSLRVQLRRAEQNASLDPLTGLHNRRHFELRFREEAAYAQRHHAPFSVVLLDLDHFKQINDTLGHDTGDRVLAHVAEQIRGVLRSDDSAFRFGGEEFLLLLRACDAQSARNVGERLRTELHTRPVPMVVPDLTVSFSAGIAAAEEANAFQGDALLRRADAALYRAKRTGRNRTELASRQA